MLPIIDHGFHKKASWLHFTRNCHIYSNRPSIHLWCITYGCLSSWLCNTHYYETQHWHVVHNRHGFHTQVSWLHFTVTAITIQLDLQLTRDVSHMVTWALYDVIKHYCQYSIHMLSHNWPWIPQESIMTIFTRNCHMYSNRHSIHLKCITYGYLGTVLRNESLLSIQHSHVVPQSTMDSTRKHNGLHFTVTAITIQIDLHLTHDVSHMVTGTLWCNKTLLSIQHSHVVP